MFVIDERDAASRSSINQKGHYRTDLMGLAVEVKDSAHNPDKWAYYGFDADGSGAGKTSGAMPHGSAAGRATMRRPQSSIPLCSPIPVITSTLRPHPPHRSLHPQHVREWQRSASLRPTVQS